MKKYRIGRVRLFVWEGTVWSCGALGGTNPEPLGTRKAVNGGGRRKEGTEAKQVCRVRDSDGKAKRPCVAV